MCTFQMLATVFCLYQLMTVRFACQQIVKSLGGEIVDSIYDCTHLVTDQVK